MHGNKSAHLPVSRLMDGYLTTQLLYIAAKLNIGDALARGPLHTEILAQKTHAKTDVLHRILRGLGAEGVLDELPDGRFQLNERGDCLRSDAPRSLRNSIIARGDLYYSAAGGLFEAARKGGVPFEREYGARFFDYLSEHPESGAAFQESMDNRAANEAAEVAAAYDFTKLERLIDVGGGQGVLLQAILAAAPRLRAILFDQPEVISRARKKLTALTPERCAFVAGDFFESVPHGNGAYLLSRIIHDWNDEAATRILRNCRAAMQPGSTLLLVEVVLPDQAADKPAAIHMDLHMLTLLGGRERTAGEYEKLLEAAGFRLHKIIPTSSPAGVSVIEAH
jgi:ubiquinone/menaquinone biosynthesis C-methylase UbiE